MDYVEWWRPCPEAGWQQDFAVSLGNKRGEVFSDDGSIRDYELCNTALTTYSANYRLQCDYSWVFKSRARGNAYIGHWSVQRLESTKSFDRHSKVHTDTLVKAEMANKLLAFLASVRGFDLQFFLFLSLGTDGNIQSLVIYDLFFGHILVRLTLLAFPHFENLPSQGVKSHG